MASNKNEASYQAAKAIYAYQVSLAGKEAYKEWSYDKALETIRKAIESDPQPVYTQLEGDILFAQGKYAEAFTCYEKVNRVLSLTHPPFTRLPRLSNLSKEAT